MQAMNAHNALYARGIETYGMGPNLFTDMVGLILEIKISRFDHSIVYI